MNRYHKELEKLKDTSLINLINTDFTSLDPRVGYEEIELGLKGYFNDRRYMPDPKGSIKARNEIIKLYNIPSLTIDDILITASTSESYNLIFSSLLKHNDIILLPKPSYPLFEHLARYSRVRVRYYDLVIRNGKWRIDIDSIKVDDKRIKAIVLITPNNPTGMVTHKEDMEAIKKIVEDKDLYLIIDEVFSSYVYKGEHIYPDTNQNVFILNGISKSLALPDLKLAWIGVRGRDKVKMIDKLETANDTYLNCSYLVQELLPQLFRSSLKFRKKWIEILNRNRDELKKFLLIEKSIIGVLPEGGIHCILNFPNLVWENEEIAIRLLKEHKLITHPGYFYDLDSPSIVISILNDNQIFKKGLSRLHEFGIKYM